MREGREPLLGWRLWRLRDGQLESWAAGTVWEPGDNTARCLSTVFRCPSSPGRGCRCGFWGLFGLLDCVRHARRQRRERLAVMGLIRAWGEIALHGQEGFRAERAAVACLVTDWPWETPSVPPPGEGLAQRWGGAWQRLRARLPAPRPDHRRPALLEKAAATYGVPLVSLEEALHVGLLAELGLDERRRREVQLWLDLRRRGVERPPD